MAIAELGLLLAGLRIGRGADGRAAVRRGRLRIWFLIEKLIKELLVQAWSVEGVAAPPMRQRQPGRCANVRFCDVAATMPGGMSSSRSRSHYVCPHAVHIESRTHFGNGRQLLIIEAYRRQVRSGRGDPDAQRLLVGRVCGNEGCWVAVEGHSAPDHLCT